MTDILRYATVLLPTARDQVSATGRDLTPLMA